MSSLQKPSVPPRVRIAPSPTGDPHIGTAYIGLFNYVYAKKHGGKFILRIEDTDQQRFRAMSEAMIMDAVKWVGLQWDEGPDVGGPYGPYKQSERLEHYRSAASDLIAKGLAYRCSCTSERLDALRKGQLDRKEQPGYDRHCRELNLPAEGAFTIRLKMPTSGTTLVKDGLRGDVSFENTTQDDLVLLKTDGFPTYHLASVVDDHLMKITHVIRGEEWLSSTPKHVQLYLAFGWEAPEFVHLPLLRNPDKSKISKRKNPTSINYYKRKGIVPEALRNFLSNMGWSMGGDKEIFTTEEMIREFDFARFSLGGPVFDIQKLEWMNGKYLKQLSPERWLSELRQPGGLLSDPYLLQVLGLWKEKIDTLDQFVEHATYFFSGDLKYDPAAFPPAGVAAAQAATWLAELLERFEALEAWDAPTLDGATKAYLKEKGLKPKEVYFCLRLALTGTLHSPSLTDVIAVLGKEIVRRRMRLAVQFLEPTASS